MNTEEKIVARALEMFNQRGIEYVGLREIAGTLQIRVSNITYYFPTKDDLVKRIALDLNKLNSQIVKEYGDITMFGFLEMFRTVFYNHLQYRCLFLSFVHLMTQNKAISEEYKKTQVQRGAALKANLQSLKKAGYLNAGAGEEMDTIVAFLTLMVRFWISEATVMHDEIKPEKHIPHYAGLLAKFLLPYSSAKGKKEIEKFLKGLSSPGANARPKRIPDA